MPCFSHKYNNLFETFFLFFSQCFFPMGNYKGSKLGTTSLLIRISVLCTVSRVCILRKSVLWTEWESLGRKWSTTMPPAFCNTQKSASGIGPVEICLIVSTVYFCCLFLYLFLIHLLTPSLACRGKQKINLSSIPCKHGREMPASPSSAQTISWQHGHYFPRSYRPVLTGVEFFALP